MSIERKNIIAAIKEVQKNSKKRNFTQSIELVVNLREIDMKSPEGRIRERIELPYAIHEKPNKICVIATGERALKAKRAKADLVIGRSELMELGGKKKELRNIANLYDFFLAEAPLMPSVGKILGPVLGPRGKMPEPVPPSVDITETIKKHRKMVSIRTRNQPLLQCSVGTETMKEEEVAENVQAVLISVQRKLKKGLKNIRNIYLKTSMGPSVKVT
ncbi:MAG: 50S ribosomal protein L1 [Candidatus Bathyarchaeota archaeon]|jgi:large subunit ribosomal protein L1